jgi:FAD/FMN-containing dehydrogenase
VGPGSYRGSRGSRSGRQRQRQHDAFPGATLAKARELKAVYDPENIFDQNFPIS